MLIFLTDIKTMEEYTFLAPLLLTIGGLIIGAILKSLLKHSRLPYTVGLFAIGIILGVMNRTGVFQSLPELHDAVSSVANINPDLILYLFLPILIFDAAYELNLHIFQEDIGQRHPVGGTRTHHLHVAHGRPHDGSSDLHPRF